MEYCEFFFGNFWHWIGGLIYLAVIFNGSFIRIRKSKKSKED